MYVATKHALNGFVRSLARLETPPAAYTDMPKIRVNAVAPARILTPMWTDHPEKMAMVGEDAGWVTPETVAETMMDLVEKEENVGGTILEVGQNVRRVEAFDDPGPKGGGNAVVNDKGEEDPMWVALKRQYDDV